MERAYLNRVDAGRVLANHLSAFSRRGDVVVLGLPRGGVPVAYEVARALGAPLDVLVVRKLGLPIQPELAMGAIASGGAQYVDHRLVDDAGVTAVEFERVLENAAFELARRETSYRETMSPLAVADRIAIVVDDGMATGATLKVAARALRSRAPARIIAALPVAPADAAERLADSVDGFVCALTPRMFFSVGQFYSDFSETSDDDVRDLLARSRGPAH